MGCVVSKGEYDKMVALRDAVVAGKDSYIISPRLVLLIIIPIVLD